VRDDKCADCAYCRVKDGVEYCVDPSDEARGIRATFVRNDEEGCAEEGYWFTPKLGGRNIVVREAVLSALPDPSAETQGPKPLRPLGASAYLEPVNFGTGKH
jgi:hypothetical protein